MANSMMTWGHVIWIFFPIPFFCLVLLSMPSYPKIEKLGTKLVGRIFFTRVSVGAFYIRLVYVGIGASLLIFLVASRSIQMGFGSAHVPCTGNSCNFHSGETMWYRRASRYRAERNFWLSLFTLVLWLLVYMMYSLKKQIVKLRGDLESVRTNGSDKKKDWVIGNGKSTKEKYLGVCEKLWMLDELSLPWRCLNFEPRCCRRFSLLISVKEHFTWCNQFIIGLLFCIKKMMGSRVPVYHLLPSVVL